MVQLDGSHHDWFEGRGPKCVLMVMVDDATNRMRARFFEQETTRASYDVFEGWVRKHGLPASLYVALDNLSALAVRFSGAPEITLFLGENSDKTKGIEQALVQFGILASAQPGDIADEQRDGEELVRQFRRPGGESAVRRWHVVERGADSRARHVTRRLREAAFRARHLRAGAGAGTSPAAGGNPGESPGLL